MEHFLLSSLKEELIALNCLNCVNPEKHNYVMLYNLPLAS